MNGLCSIYRNVYDTTSQHTIGVDKAIERIKGGRSRQRVIELRAEHDENKRSDIKSNLPSITFSGVFSERSDDKLVSHSGFMCLDFDDVELSEYIPKFREWEHTYACWISPSGNGLKVLLKIANGQKHREHFSALLKKFPNADPKCANESRVCYESYDPEIYVNTSSKVWVECIKYEVVESHKVTTDTYEVYKKLVAWTEKSTKSDKTFHDGNRNHFAYIIAGAMCRFGIHQEDAETLLVRDYAQSDFTKKEIANSVKSAYKKNRNNSGTAEFSNSNIRTKETHYEINPEILSEGYKPDDVIYGSDVYNEAVDIYLNGYKSATSTRIASIDPYFKWKKKELTLLSGIGNYGKSSFANQLMVIKSYFDGDKWAVFSPENSPAQEYYVDLAEILLGCGSHKGSPNQPPRELFDRAYEFVSNHFFFIYPESISPSPEFIKTKFMELILKEKVSGVVIDPFNQLSNDYSKQSGRSDKYLETFLSDCSRFATVNDLYFLLVAHPHKMYKDDTGNYPCPDVFDLADGAMWNNKCDNILIYHRPMAQSSPDNPLCEFHSKKIRRQKMVGIKGSVEFELDRKRRRFIFKGGNPLDGNRFEYGATLQPAITTGNPNIFTEPTREIDNEIDAPF